METIKQESKMLSKLKGSGQYRKWERMEPADVDQPDRKLIRYHEYNESEEFTIEYSISFKQLTEIDTEYNGDELQFFLDTVTDEELLTVAEISGEFEAEIFLKMFEICILSTNMQCKSIIIKFTITDK